MARILHVENERDWIDIIGEALAGHDLDTARSYGEALGFLERYSSYDLAVVDLHLRTSSDGLGGELLDLLRIRYPGTPRIVVTGSPPAGPIRQNIFERYEVEEIIIKSQFAAPDLRKVVEDSLSRRAAEVPQVTKLQRSELRQRLRDLQRSEGNLIRRRIAEMEEFARGATRQSPYSGHLAREQLAKARAVASSFQSECNRIERLVDDVRTPAEAAAADEELERVEAHFTMASRGDDLSPPHQDV